MSNNESGIWDVVEEVSKEVAKLDVSDKVDLATTDKIADVARAVVHVHELQKKIVFKLISLQQRMEKSE